MRKYAFLKEPAASGDGRRVFKIMLYEAPEGIYLFEYDSPDALRCSADRLYASLEELTEDWNGLLDGRGWIELEDPLPDCQVDAFVPLRVKGRDKGRPQWGTYEILKDGQWTEYRPE